MVMHTGDLLTELLIGYGVESVFGMPGGQTLALYDGIARRESKIRHVTLRDERSTVYAADAYARLTNRIGVCDVTVGPGAIKLPSGLFEAYGSSIPVLAIVSDVPMGWSHLMERGTALQSMDQESLLRPLCKRVATLRSPEQLPALLGMLMRTATSGRPGPVALIIPQDVFDQRFEYGSIEARVDPTFGVFPSIRSVPDWKDVERAASALAAAHRPVLLAGGGTLISHAEAEVRMLAERLSMPVITTFSGRGIMEDDHPLSLGLLGNLGVGCAKRAAEESDLIFVVGCKSGQNSTFNWTFPKAGQKVVQLDVDGAEIGKVFPAEVGLVGDARLGLRALIEVLGDQVGASMEDGERAETTSRTSKTEWVRSLREAWQTESLTVLTSDAIPILPQRVIAELNKLTGPDDLIVCDASYPSGWGMMYYCLRRVGRTILAPRGSGGLGFGFPAAIGASFACPDRRVINLAGDGGCSYYVGEFASMLYHELKIINIVFNNRSLAWIDHYHRIFFEGSGAPFRWNDVDFAAVGRAYGCMGIRIERPEDLSEGLREALQADKPAVVDIIVSGEETPIAAYREAMDRQARSNPTDK